MKRLGQVPDDGFHAAAGPLEFEIAGVKLKGAAAPVTFWILCFLSGVIAIKLLWQPAC